MGQRMCTVAECLEIERGTRADYEALSCFHYRSAPCTPYVAVYTMRDCHARRRSAGPVGVIVYVNPTPNAELRTVATGGMFTGLGDRGLQMQTVNRNIRTIARVIIEPRYRGLGLASRLVAETMGLLQVPINEATAVMGKVNPFFERAGMQAFTGAEPARVVQLKEAFSSVGIEDDELIDAVRVQAGLDELTFIAEVFIEEQIRRFLQSYGKRSHMRPGLERTRFVLSKLTPRPVYYIWFNPDRQIDLVGETPPENVPCFVFGGVTLDGGVNPTLRV